MREGGDGSTELANAEVPPDTILPVLHQSSPAAPDVSVNASGGCSSARRTGRHVSSLAAPAAAPRRAASPRAGPVSEGATKIAPDPHADRKAPKAPSTSGSADAGAPPPPPRTLARRAYAWCFPPMRPYDELCANLNARSLHLFHVDGAFRRVCIYVVKSKAFERLSLSLILANCVFLAMDSKDPDFASTRGGAMLRVAEWVFMVAFTVEMVVKIAALGLVGARGSYLRDPWNVIDFAVVVMGWLSLSPSIQNVSAMRSVRVLRPLRTITGVEGMRMLVSTLLSSLPMLLDVLILVAFLFLIFGTVAVQTFSGALRRRCGEPAPGAFEDMVMVNVTTFRPIASGSAFCGDGIIQLPASGAWFALNGTSDPAPVAGSGFNCGRVARDGAAYGTYCFSGGWDANPNFGFTSFDNILWSWLTIFQCVSLEGWTDVMYMVQDGVHDVVWIYFVVLTIFGAFFAVNLALAVLYLHFTQAQVESEVEAEAAAAAEEARAGAAAAARGVALSLRGSAAEEAAARRGPWARLRRACQCLEGSTAFEALTMSLIVLNTVTMASEHHGMAATHVRVNETINLVLTGYFTVEMLIKLAALGVRGYLAERMNAFDGLVVLASLVELVIWAGARGGGGATLSVFRAFRLMRIFKLARRWEELNKIVRTIFKSVFSIAYLSLLLLVFIFIMALLGMQIFGYRFAFCGAEGATQMCPPGLNINDPCPGGGGDCYRCPSHRDCYVPCAAAEWGSWIAAPGSPYNGLAFCERFPPAPAAAERPPTGHEEWTYLAQAGKSEVARHNFDNIFTSVITIFQILTGENWNTVMYDGMRTTTSAAAFYFLFIVIIGNYVVLNLFLAILLDKFAGGDGGRDTGPRGSSDGGESVHLSGLSDDEAEGGDEGRAVDTKAEYLLGLHGMMKSALDSVMARKKQQGGGGIGGTASAAPSARPSLSSVPASVLNAVEHTVADGGGAPSDEETLEGRALCIFGPHSHLRAALAAAIWHPRFEQAVIVLICLSSITLALDSPRLDPEGRTKHVLAIADKCFVVVFAIEAAMKIIVYGLLLAPNAYLKSPWNVLDFVTVVVGIVLVAVGDGRNSQLASLRSLRTLRALRPIRMASRAPGMKVVVNALFQSIPASANVLLVCFLFYLIFGILFVDLMKGSFERCEADGARLDPDYFLPAPQQPMTQAWCEAGSHTITGTSAAYHARIPPATLPDAAALRDGNTYELRHAWVKPGRNFDHIFVALLSLFEIASLEMWPDFMYAGVDAVGAGLQPLANHNPKASLYFVGFVIVGSFFVLNLFVGVAIDKFNGMQAEHLGQNVLLTPEQEQWVTIQRLMSNCKPAQGHEAPANPLRAAIFRVVMSDTFDAFIMTIIALNILALALNYVGMPAWLVAALFWLNLVFTAIFLLEAAAKMVALGVAPYLRDRWCAFDCFVAVLSLIQIAIDVWTSSDIPAVNLLRVFRVARIFRLVPKAKGLRTLFQTLVFSLPALVNVGSVFFLFMFIFAIMGMSLFGHVRHGAFLERHANFATVPNALLVLMRMSTGESWNGIMHDAMTQSACEEVLTPFVNAAGARIPAGSWHDARAAALAGAPPGAVADRCGPTGYITVVYFMLFVLLCAFLLLNLVIAVILDNFQSSTNNEELEVSQSNLLNYAQAWSALDPRCTMFIPTARLSKLLELVEPPLGVAGLPHPQLEVQTVIMSVDIPNRSFRGAPHVHFLEVLHALAGRIAGVQLPTDEAEKAQARFAGLLPEGAGGAYPKYSAAHYHAALHVQAAVRGFLARYRMRGALEEEGGGGEWSAGSNEAPG